jgi:hypothetical protein
VRFCLARGSVAPSGGIPPRSGLGTPLGRGPVSIESRAPPRASYRLARGHHGPAAFIPAPPAGAFNALTFAGAQVKDESTLLRAWESRPGTALPTPLARPSPPLCDAVWHGQATTPWRCTTHSRTAGAPHPRKRMAEPSKGRRTTTPRPRKDNAMTSGRWDWSSPSPSALCDHPRHPQRRPGHCITIPGAVGACGDRTPPRRLPCLVRPHVSGTLEPSQ